MLTPLVADLLAALFGLVVGSYLNVVIHRLPRGLSTVRPRSSCPHCGTLIPAHHNLPLVSYLFLGGRCGACRAPISWRYPAIEALTALLFVICVERFGLQPGALAAMVFCALLVALALIDLEHFLLPDRLTLPGIVVGLALQPVIPWTSFRDAVIGVAVGAGVLWATYWGWRLLRNEEGLGLGDVKMLAMVGAFLGWKGVLVTLFLGALSGAVVGLAAIALDRAFGGGGAGGGEGERNLKTQLPFGTFLSLGALVALFFGPWLIDLYTAYAFGPAP